MLDALKQKGISIRVASPKLVMEEAPESYKDVTQVSGLLSFLFWSLPRASLTLCAPLTRSWTHAMLPASPRRP